MKKTSVVVAASLLALTACAPMGAQQFAGPPPFDPKNPKVYVVVSQTDPTKKSVVVDQEPIYFFRHYGPKVPIRWQLQTPGYRFDAANGIGSIKTLSGASGQVHSCQVEAGSNAQAFVCLNENTATGFYKYTINVVAADKTHVPNPPPLDPSVGND
jgi:hypothetical protein